MEQIRTWKEVQSVRRDNQGLHITAGNVEAVVRRLLDEDEDLQDLEIHRAGRAQTFTELTQETVQ